MDEVTEMRIAALERKLEEYDRLIAKLVRFAKTSKSGRVLVQILGL